MANRRCIQALTRRASSLLTPNLSLHSLTIPVSLPIQTLEPAVTSNLSNNGSHLDLNQFIHWSQLRHFSSDNRNEDDDEEEDDDDDEDEDDDDVEESSDDESVSGGGVKREYSQEEKEAEAEAIGYKVAGPLDRSDRVFKPYEPVFAVVQIGSHQFKVSNGDCIFTERLKFCEVNEKPASIKSSRTWAELALWFLPLGPECLSSC